MKLQADLYSEILYIKIQIKLMWVWSK